VAPELAIAGAHSSSPSSGDDDGALRGALAKRPARVRTAPGRRWSGKAIDFQSSGVRTILRRIRIHPWRSRLASAPPLRISISSHDLMVSASRSAITSYRNVMAACKGTNTTGGWSRLQANATPAGSNVTSHSEVPNVLADRKFTRLSRKQATSTGTSTRNRLSRSAPRQSRRQRRRSCRHRHPRSS
jgi:hypothetical protein